MRGLFFPIAGLFALGLSACASAPLSFQAGAQSRCFRLVYMPAEYVVNPRTRLVRRPGQIVREVKDGDVTHVDFVRRPAIYLETRRLVHADYYSLAPADCADDSKYASLASYPAKIDEKKIRKLDFEKLLAK